MTTTNAFPSTEPPQPAVPAAIRLHTPTAAGLATFLGGSLAGTWILAVNYHRLGATRERTMVIAIGLFVTVAVFGLAMVVPDTVPGAVFYLPLFLGYYYAAKSAQGEAVEQHRAGGGQIASLWAAAGAGVVFLIVQVIVVVLLVVMALALFGDGLGTPVTFNGGNTIYYADDATDSETRHLGQVLTDAGYFPPDGAATVVLRRTDGQATVAFIIQSGVSDDPAAVDLFREMGQHIRREAIADLTAVELWDEWSTVQKTISLD
ncbi:MAG: hypothetical protein WD534_02245 [Phycisphaeraceae bacterium]